MRSKSLLKYFEGVDDLYFSSNVIGWKNVHIDLNPFNLCFILTIGCGKTLSYSFSFRTFERALKNAMAYDITGDISLIKSDDGTIFSDANEIK